MSSQETVANFVSQMKSLSMPFSSPITDKSKTNKQSEDGDKMKVKFLEAWNNFKFELQDVTEMNWKKNSPLWLLGQKYVIEQDEESECLYTEETKEKSHSKHLSLKVKQFFEDFSSRPWFTYRKGFPPFADTTLTSDTGWGCMIRTSQMMLCQGLFMHFLGRDWRWRSMKPDQLEAKKLHREIVSWFLDEPNQRCPFSIHRLTDIGLNYKCKPGDWYGPSTTAYILQDAVECSKGAKSKLNEVMLYVAQDCTVYTDDVRDMCRWREAKGPDGESNHKSVVILIPLRLGESTMNPIYTSSLQGLFQLHNCLGIVGGRPKHSLYFVGVQDDQLIYLDPHYSQNSDDLQSFSNKHLRFYHSTSPRKLLISKIDPSCCLGFYCRDEAEFDLFTSQATALLTSSDQKSSSALYLISNGSVNDHKYTEASSLMDGCNGDELFCLDPITELSNSGQQTSQNPAERGFDSRTSSSKAETTTKQTNASSSSISNKFVSSLAKPKEFLVKIYRQQSRSPKFERKEISLEEEFELL